MGTQGWVWDNTGVVGMDMCVASEPLLLLVSPFQALTSSRRRNCGSRALTPQW